MIMMTIMIAVNIDICNEYYKLSRMTKAGSVSSYHSVYASYITSHDVGGCASHCVRSAFSAVSTSKEGL